MTTNLISIRSYTTHDRLAVRAVAWETADGGQPPDVWFRDREFLADILTRYYTDFEPESAWVAVQNDRVVGYLTGCLDTARYQRLMTWRVVPVAVFRAVLRGALWDRAVRALLAANFRGVWQVFERRQIPLDTYPAHLHVDLLTACRGQGVGPQMVARFLAQARAAGRCGVYAGIREDNFAAIRFFERLGFEQILRHPLFRLPSGVLLSSVVMGRRLC